MRDETNSTTANPFGLPACLGGEPVRRPGTFRTTPERGQLEEDFLTTWVREASNWEPDAPDGGMPLADGVVLDQEIADALGWEPAAFAAEFLAMQAPGQTGLTAVPNNNGTRIITAAFAALAMWAGHYGLRRPVVGSEVIVPAATWQASAGALLSRNLVPVLVDVDPDTLTLDPAKVAQAITDRTVGIVAVHLYGRLADMDALMALADKHKLFVLEDCAHAHGARFADGRGAGTVGHAGTFSMQGSKTLAGGEGGLAISRLRHLALQIASIVTCGRQLPGTQTLQADNDRMPAVVAALLRAQLCRFPAQNDSRLQVFPQIDAIAAELDGVTALPRQDAAAQPTYKQLLRFDLSHFADMTLAQVAKALEAELGCELATIYQPLTNSPLYTPLSDPANDIDDDYRQRINPSRYPSPAADDAYHTILAIEHAAGLDPEFPKHLATAIHKVQAHASTIKHQLTA